MTNQSSASSDCSKPDATDVAASADKVAEERKRLATLIGRMLARHWLHHRPAAREQSPTAHGKPGSRKKRR
jgi:hypothetical protein